MEITQSRSVEGFDVLNLMFRWAVTFDSISWKKPPLRHNIFPLPLNTRNWCQQYLWSLCFLQLNRRQERELNKYLCLGLFPFLAFIHLWRCHLALTVGPRRGAGARLLLRVPWGLPCSRDPQTLGCDSAFASASVLGPCGLWGRGVSVPLPPSWHIAAGPVPREAPCCTCELEEDGWSSADRPPGYGSVPVSHPTSFKIKSQALWWAYKVLRRSVLFLSERV